VGIGEVPERIDRSVITGIVVALPEELSTLTKVKLKKGKLLQLSDAITLGYSGAGRQNAARAAQLLVESGVDRLVSWGCAAGLNPQYRPGDLVLAAYCQTVSGDRLVTDTAWRDLLKSVLPVSVNCHEGVLVEATGLIAESHAKADMANRTGADALDMESVAIAEIANAKQLPFLVVRAVADPVEMDLPEAVRIAFNNDGEVEMGKLLKHLVLHPMQLPGLIRLGRHFNAASATLKQVAGQLNAIAV
jgi:adenosylhomocysteine nucleosidase